MDEAADAIMMDNSILSPLNSTTTRSPAKIDSVYTSVHAMEVISNLLKDACSYLEIYSNNNSVEKNNKLQLPCDCLRLAIDGLDQHANIIGQAIQNSSDTKEVKLAQKVSVQYCTYGIRYVCVMNTSLMHSYILSIYTHLFRN